MFIYRNVYGRKYKIFGFYIYDQDESLIFFF